MANGVETCHEDNQNPGTIGEKGLTTQNNKIQWLIHGAVGLTCGTASYAIISSDWLGGYVTWSFIMFLVSYTVVLFLIFTYFTRNTSDCSSASSRPNGLTRLRSYLTFLPITTIIPHVEGKESFRNTETTANDGLNENELSIRINLQKDLVIEAILEEYIAPWYTKISSSTIFLQQCRDILQSVFSRLGEKIKQVDRNDFAKEAIQTVHLHWKEYCEASENAAMPQDILKRFKFVHPFLQDTSEVARKYEELVCRLLEDLVIPDLQSQVLCQFLSGILVKSFFLYYAEVITQPSWINSNLITLLRSGSLLVELPGYSSQNSSAPVTPQPERSPKPLTGDISPSSTPTPSESSWVGVESPKSSASLGKSKEERCFFGKESQSSSKDMSSACIAEESQTINFDKKSTDYEIKMSQETSSRISSKCIVTSVTTALSGVIPTTTLPLLPSGCFGYDSYKHASKYMKLEEDSSIALCEKILTSKHPEPTSKVLVSTKDDSNEKIITTDTIFSDEEPHESPPVSKEHDDSSPIRECHSENDKNDSSNMAKTPTHYYSFDEINRRKSTHQFLDAGTLSVDGSTDVSRSDKSSTHHLKLDGSELEAGSKPTRSPVYEEPEDFATSIAKLRSLLEQRDSKKSLTGDDRNVTPEVDNSLCGCSENNSESSYSAASKDQLLDQKDEPFEAVFLGDKLIETRDRRSEEDDSLKSVPELKCRFFNISIPKVESCHDHGGQYDFYCIQYEGVYFDEVYDDDEPPRVILRNTTVKRRFKEFVTLQSKLEEHSSLKPHLKGIKAPNRWLNLSFSKADAAATRKAMLERYLHQLCYHPTLGACPEVLQFMAYGDDGFYPDPLDIHDPKHLLSDRLEKLAKKFTGVMNTLKDVLPSFDSNPPSPRSEGEFPICQDGTVAQEIPSFEFSERLSPEERDVTQEISAKALMGPKWLETLVPLATNRENADEESNPHTPNGQDETSEEQPSKEPLEDLTEEGKICSAYPLAAALTQLLCDVLWLPNCRPHNVSVSTFMSISGKSIENYVQETIDVFLSEEALLGYLEWVNKSLKSPMDIPQDLPFDACSEIDLKNCLKRRIPAWVRWMWGRNRLDMTIERITGFFQNPIINHDLVLSLSELMFSKI